MLMNKDQPDITFRLRRGDFAEPNLKEAADEIESLRKELNLYKKIYQRQNPSGCACSIDRDTDELISACGLHKGLVTQIEIADLIVDFLEEHETDMPFNDSVLKQLLITYRKLQESQ